MTETEFQALVADLATTKDPLKLTTIQMLSSDPIERFKAEYNQLKIRIQRLEHSLENWEEFKAERCPRASKAALTRQLGYMRSLFDLFAIRAKIENIDVDN